MLLQYSGSGTKILGKALKTGDTIEVTPAQAQMLKGKYGSNLKQIAGPANKVAPRSDKLLKKTTSTFRSK